MRKWFQKAAGRWGRAMDLVEQIMYEHQASLQQVKGGNPERRYFLQGELLQAVGSAQGYAILDALRRMVSVYERK